MGYYIDLEKISITDYKKSLQSTFVLPSRKILKEKIDKRFNHFAQLGITNLKQLNNALTNKVGYSILLQNDIFTDNYLKILLRDLNSVLPKPHKFCNFSILTNDTITKLDKAGVKNTYRLYNSVLTQSKREELAKVTGINKTDILILTKLTDVSRIKWVGITYAQILIEIEADTVEKISKSKVETLHSQINSHIKTYNIFKGKIGVNDIKLLIESAGKLPLDIEY